MIYQKHILFFLLIMLCAVIQTTLTVLLPAPLQPDLLLALVILAGLYMNPAVGSVYAVGIGYLQDLLTLSIVGLFMLGRVIIYILGNRLSHEFYAKSAPAQVIVIFLLGIVDTILIFVLSAIFGQDAHFKWYMLWHTPLRSLTTALFGVPLFFVIKKIWE